MKDINNYIKMISFNNYIIEKLKINKDISTDDLLEDIIEIISPNGEIIDDEIKDIIKKWLNGYNKTVDLFYSERSKFNPESFNITSGKIKFKKMSGRDWEDAVDMIDHTRDEIYRKDTKVIWQVSITLIFSAAFTNHDDYGIMIEKGELN